MLAVATPALAHHRPAHPIAGVPIPSLAHGQMEVYARHWGEILGLAAREPVRTDTFSRVLNFARIQKAWCLWGLAPRAIVDEESPFNECSHAYLAAARALLDDMRRQAAPDSDVERLAQTVDRELVLAGAPTICGFSGEDFDTASHVVPRWGDVSGHWPSLIPLAGLIALVLAMAGTARRLLRPAG